MRNLYLLFFPFFALSQNFIANSDLPAATGMSNGPKIVLRNIFSDTIHCVFQKSDGIYYARSEDRGQHWTTQFLYPGRNPSIALSENGYRHIVWEKDTAGNSEIYYYCLDIRSPPVNVSQTPGKSYLPSLAISRDGIHIVWADSSFGPSRIYYRRLNSDTFQLTGFNPSADHSYPTIGLFERGRVYVFWQSYSPANSFPYRIYGRYWEGDTWRNPLVIDSSVNTLLHPTCDFTGEEDFSLGYEFYSQGNLDCRFLGGNGGGYPTPGRSTYPVLSTITTTWSYLAWMENEADILLHFYYFMTGWWRLSLRDFLSIPERVYHPNFYGAHLIWTQGENAPYRVMHYFFDYPIGIRSGSKKLLPPSQPTNIIPTKSQFSLKNLQAGGKFYDLKGERVDELKSGIYFLYQKGKSIDKIIILR
uniref:T9SS type A sorting domain-containing protein n=1 Tax=candidate division WOR-3 bacterium TaxID=2052148 RepID=A0A7C3UZB5_UNCW3